MSDLATPNLPSRDFDATEAFYAKLGFERGYRGDGWMILNRGPEDNRIVLEFFPYPDLDPTKSSFSCCIRLDDLAPMMDQIRSSDIQRADKGTPRFHEPRLEASGLVIAYMVDIDGTLVRLIQNN